MFKKIFFCVFGLLLFSVFNLSQVGAETNSEQNNIVVSSIDSNSFEIVNKETGEQAVISYDKETKKGFVLINGVKKEFFQDGNKVYYDGYVIAEKGVESKSHTSFFSAGWRFEAIYYMRADDLKKFDRMITFLISLIPVVGTAYAIVSTIVDWFSSTDEPNYYVTMSCYKSYDGTQAKIIYAFFNDSERTWNGWVKNKIEIYNL